MRSVRHKLLMVLAVVLTLAACASQPKNQIMLMPAPDVFDEGDWDPFTDRNPIKDIPYGGILYATDREPARGNRPPVPPDSRPTRGRPCSFSG